MLRPQELFWLLHFGTVIKTGVSWVGRKPFKLRCSGDMPAIQRSQQPLLEAVLFPWTNRSDSSIKTHLHLHCFSSVSTVWAKEVWKEMSFKTYLEYPLITRAQLQRADFWKSCTKKTSKHVETQQIRVKIPQFRQSHFSCFPVLLIPYCPPFQKTRAAIET